MKKSIFEQIGGTYYCQDDYFLPNIAVPESIPIGVWGQRHLKYIKKQHQAIYTAMLVSGELSNYLSENRPTGWRCVFAACNADGRTGRYYRAVQSESSDGVGGAYEQHQKQSRRNNL